MPQSLPVARLRAVASIVIGVAVLALLDRTVQVGMGALHLPAVGPVPAMLLLVGLLLIVHELNPVWAQALRHLAQPAVAFLLRWMPLFFAPPLIALPLVPTPEPATLARIALVVLGGFLVNLLLVVGLAAWVRGRGPRRAEPDVDPPLAPFNVQWVTVSLWLTVAVMLAQLSRISGMQAYLCVPGLLAAAVGSFLLGLKLPARLRLVLHPLVTCAIGTHAVLALSPWKIADFSTQRLDRPGPGDLLLALLGPSVLALGVQVYDRRALLRRHIVQLAGVLGICAPLSLVATVAAGRLLDLPRAWILALAPRSVTIPIAVPIAGTLHADVGRTASAVVLTGILGAVIGRSILNLLQVRDPAVRGLGIGAASHGVGTAALVTTEPVAAAVAGLAFALFAVWSALAVSFPGFVELLMAVAGP